MQLLLNADKTFYMLFNHEVQLNVKFNDKIIKRADHYKILGFTIDSKLKFDIHANILARKLNYSAVLLRSLRGKHLPLFPRMSSLTCDVTCYAVWKKYAFLNMRH